MGFTFSVICFSETWLVETTSSNKSLYELIQIKLYKYSSNEKAKKGGGVTLDINQSVEFKIQNDLSINSDDVESISVELLFENRKNTIFNVCRQPKVQIERFEKFLEE